MQFLTTKRLKFYIEQAGSGPHVLVINGTGSDLRRKPSIMDSPLPTHFCVTAYDQRGLRQSDTPEGPIMPIMPMMPPPMAQWALIK